jgi:uncharacterized protein YqjF (DUF2071 family)
VRVIAGYQNWRDLLFVHWCIRAQELRPLVPASFDIEEFDGQAYISLVPFTVKSARPVGAPKGGGLDFLETNVRTYVRAPSGESGVYFFSLDAASLLATLGARVSLGLPYFWATGRQRAEGNSIDYRIRRRLDRPVGCHVRYTVGQYRGPALAGTLDHFLIERYVLHAQRGPTLWTVRVHHHPYPLSAVRLDLFEDRLVAAAGCIPRADPALVHFASGVDVAISAPQVRPVRVRAANPY